MATHLPLLKKRRRKEKEKRRKKKHTHERAEKEEKNNYKQFPPYPEQSFGHLFDRASAKSSDISAV